MKNSYLGLAITLTATLFLVQPAFSDPEMTAARQAVQAAIDASAAGWTAGKLDQFMAVYDNAPTTTFVAGDKVVYGYQAIWDRYAKSYGAPGKTLGKLTIETIDFRQLDPSNAFVIGRYHLAKTDGTNGELSGLTTLLFHLTPAGWKIISDHSD